jgi:hypothetical protein
VLAILANTFVCDVLSDLRPLRRSSGLDCHVRSGAHTGPLLLVARAAMVACSPLLPASVEVPITSAAVIIRGSAHSFVLVAHVFALVTRVLTA